jgi:hypothetical protein
MMLCNKELQVVLNKSTPIVNELIFENGKFLGRENEFLYKKSAFLRRRFF